VKHIFEDLLITEHVIFVFVSLETFRWIWFHIRRLKLNRIWYF